MSSAKVQNCIDPELDSPGELQHAGVAASYYRYAYNNFNIVKNQCILRVQNIEKACSILFCHIISNHKGNEEASLVFSNAHHVLSQCNTGLMLLYLLNTLNNIITI